MLMRYLTEWCLPDDAVNILIAQIQPVAVFSRPAAGAVQVAGAGRIQKNRPRDIAVILIPKFLLLFPADHVRVQEEIRHQLIQNAGMHLFQNTHRQLSPVRIRVIDQEFPEILSLNRKGSV
jgi:hypothetical protein